MHSKAAKAVDSGNCQLAIGLVERPYDVCIAQHRDRLLEGFEVIDAEEDCGRAAVDGP